MKPSILISEGFDILLKINCLYHFRILNLNIYFPEKHEIHNPQYEGYTSDGNIPAYEIPERAKRVVSVLKTKQWANILQPNEFSLKSIQSIHSETYLTYFKNAFSQWENFSPVNGIAFIPGTFGINPEEVAAGTIAEKAGFFLMDTTISITAGTYAAALQSAFAALSGAQEVAKNQRSAFAVCRPPGHHAGHSICGGYCFLNNASIAADWLSQKGKVGILDIDFHAGNGTQEIFYDRSDVFVVSIHADPAREYPRFAGFEEEVGSGAGEGYHKNFPLPAGIGDSGYLSTLEEALLLLTDFSPGYLVVSAGMDIYEDDPLGDFKVTKKGIQEIGIIISELSLPTLIVMEGGYHLPTLGENFAHFLEPFTT